VDNLANYLTSINCNICGNSSFSIFKESNLKSSIDINDYQITDSNYGLTGLLIKCEKCGFIQSFDSNPVLPFYEKMIDVRYEETRDQRAIQAMKLLQKVKQVKMEGNLLDIGCGSGILVEEAIKIGYHAEGIEPSVWMCEKAQKRGLPVHHGVLPHPSIKHRFNIITIIDVIEHVSDPMKLLHESYKLLVHDGILLVVTPNVNSFAAKLVGSNWWHYRIAHVGYFNKRTLMLALANAGFHKIFIYHPSWYFPLDYLYERLQKYFSALKIVPLPAFLRRSTIPLNLFDSLAAIYQKRA